MNTTMTIGRSLVKRALKQAIAWRYRHYRLGAEPERWTRLAGLHLRVLPDVFNPGMYFTSRFLASHLMRPGVVPNGGAVLDMGTGSGVLALVAARAGAEHVVACDLSPIAVRCARENAARAGLAGRVEVRQGDLFAPVAGERFDLIVCNPPYFPGTPSNYAEHAFLGGPNYEWIGRFATALAAHLAPGGRALLVLGDATDLAAIRRRLQSPGLRVRRVARRDILVEVLYIYELTYEITEGRP